MNKADQRDFDSHYEYWDKLDPWHLGGEMKKENKDTDARYTVRVILPSGREEFVEGIFDTTRPINYIRWVLVEAALKVWDGVTLDLILDGGMEEGG